MIHKTMAPVFIGNFRSGTTLLANLLGFHEELAPWFETKALCEALRWLRVVENPEAMAFEARLAKPEGLLGFDAEAVAKRMREDFRLTAARIAGEAASGKGGHEHYPIGHDYVLYSLAEARQSVDAWLVRVSGAGDAASIAAATGLLISSLGRLHATAGGKAVWVNKTPEIPRFGRELRQAIGPCRIILMIRDGREVVRSARRLGWATDEYIAAWWKGMILESRAAARDHPEDYLEVRYERLVSNPVEELDAVLSFIGVSREGRRMVDQYNRRLPAERRLGIMDAGAGTRHGAVRDSSRTFGVDPDFLRDLGYS